MHIFITGHKDRNEALQQLLAPKYQVTLSDQVPSGLMPHIELLIDTSFDEDPDTRLKVYLKTGVKNLWLHTLRCTITPLLHRIPVPDQIHIAGINALPLFINSPLWEMYYASNSDEKIAEKILSPIGKKMLCIPEQMGMLSPRIIFMIINEAYYVVQEGVTTRADTDMAMKLGTNYPYGPFEWAEKLGIKNVYHTLLSLLKDSGDPRYKICALLRREAETAF